LARARALNGIGFMCWADVYRTDKHAELEEALSIGLELGDAGTAAAALRNLGLIDTIQEHYEKARRNLEKSLEIRITLEPERRHGRAHTLGYFGDLAMREGNEAEARSMFEEAVQGFAASGDLNFRAYGIRRLAQLAWRGGDVKQAFALCRQSLEFNLQVADPRGICACLAGFAAIALVQGKLTPAMTLAAAVEKQLTTLGIPLLLVDRMEFERNVASLREALDAKSLRKLQAAGAAMSMEQAIEFALQVDG
jgi:tetratricopeptide (TPR) repeat protein